MPDVLAIYKLESLTLTIYDVNYIRIYFIGFCIEFFKIIMYLVRFELHLELSLTDADPTPFDADKKEPFSTFVQKYMTQDRAHMRAFGWGITVMLGENFHNSVPLGRY
jgi:hypothetical protein